MSPLDLAARSERIFLPHGIVARNHAVATGRRRNRGLTESAGTPCGHGVARVPVLG
ncbi:hypothetical protein H7J87_25890 [Mycolicibacterium wolinskyi]|uniref:hypothetical protein n=1 Tax=Mycolicibacterium TaxID=1866885 RepID=UPI0013FDC6B1|nr:MULTISPECIES: hypothetical protein [Mycolicibacterium]MCV7288765.1 hypothetical protein [Mycolicibacterium wolinskyi]MCV7295987.1 hypothetical protein [Mycolicibacterium goodii]